MRTGDSAKEFMKKHGQTLFNVLLFGVLLRYAIVKASGTLIDFWNGRGFDFVEVTFFLHNLIFCGLVLVRRQHRALDRNLLHQSVALAAFFSGIFFIETSAAGPVRLRAAQVIIGAAIVLGTITLLNLGRSFGILIGLRQVETGGLYGIIRHPMYFTDILWRVGIVIKDAAAWNLALFVMSTAAYISRALLEERFLRREPAYAEYMKRVRYRFIPGLF